MTRQMAAHPSSLSLSLNNEQGEAHIVVCVCVCVHVQQGVFNSFLLLQTNNLKWNRVTPRGDTHSSTDSCVDSLF